MQWNAIFGHCTDTLTKYDSQVIYHHRAIVLCVHLTSASLLLSVYYSSRVWLVFWPCGQASIFSAKIVILLLVVKLQFSVLRLALSRQWCPMWQALPTAIGAGWVIRSWFLTQLIMIEHMLWTHEPGTGGVNRYNLESGTTVCDPCTTTCTLMAAHVYEIDEAMLEKPRSLSSLSFGHTFSDLPLSILMLLPGLFCRILMVVWCFPDFYN